ncbi:PREDICTED: MORN repeat-containing protein 4 [Nicrophorus vespilloides]|uniref:MORN repeat-containing protein 4 n=1 Tax=Nicrophorus vespilloides TaxID=110193 RepID=A0ABM1MLZ1_NICVS|nr:PREDICTED: MORN repeat-containing protein 4 [Nicrophorus vespilloides]
MEKEIPKVAKIGGYRHEGGAIYVGGWTSGGKREGIGHMLFPDGSRYDGYFTDGMFNGLGILTFADGAKYEGEFSEGWFHGYGVFWRADGMKHEGEFRGGKMWGLGMTTFKDGTNGFPKNEGFFQDCRLVRKKKCPEIVQKTQKISLMTKQLFDNDNM